MSTWTSRLLEFGFTSIDLWRSEEMQLVQLMIPAESAHDTIAALGEVGLLQFKDLNSEKSAFQRTYANQVKRCEEMARKLRFLSEQVDKAGVVKAVKPFQEKGYELDELEAKLEDLEAEIVEINANTERIRRSHSELVELQLVLEKAASFFDQAKFDAVHENIDRGGVPDNVDAPLLESVQPNVDQKVTRLGFVAGLIQQEKAEGFERLLFRATRGNVYLKQSAVGKVTDPSSGELQEKRVFVVFFAGERSRTKIMKICEAFGANRYPFPEDVQKQRQMHAEVNARLRELHSTIEAGDRHREGVLQNVAANLDQWQTLVRREKAIYHSLNKLNIDVTRKVLVAEAWVPAAARSRVHEALRQAAEQSSTQVGTVLQPLLTTEPPPTYFKTSKFTDSFQTIVNAYGTARYREVNPAVYTIMTFPFLFAVMFGDLGHGFLMLLFASWILWSEKKLMGKDLGDMFGMIFGGRYVIFLMALFSCYIGIIYNEYFSMPMGIFGWTRFKCEVDGNYIDLPDLRECHNHHGKISFSRALGDTPYPCGFDPIWHGTKTELPYFNSLKMKMSIVIGVIHMNLGIVMSLYNHLYFRDHLSIYTEFIPQMLFLNSIFGYLVFLIVYKWASGKITDLYHVLIYMFLEPGTVDDPMYAGQGGLQSILLLIAFFAVPWMLFPKPFILKSRHKASKPHKPSTDQYGLIEGEDEEEVRPAQQAGGHSGGGGGGGGGGGHGDHGHGEHFDFGEIMVHQMIHTIEFVLGAVSNTASYLRLWALSLAHSQLSSVFYDRVLMARIAASLEGNAAVGIVQIFIGFFVFACATLGVLMIMESLSAFLHALRLHWVEFMNKFYRGDGYAFAPFNFDKKENPDE